MPMHSAWPRSHLNTFMRKRGYKSERARQVSRGLLPDTGSEYEGEGGRISDALEFLLLNFTEMNKLWVRMQHQGSPKDRQAPDLPGLAIRRPYDGTVGLLIKPNDARLRTRLQDALVCAWRTVM